MSAEQKFVHFDGPCPFLLCMETGPHDHGVCPECGAVRYGNISCPTCRVLRPLENARIKRWLRQAGVGPEV